MLSRPPALSVFQRLVGLACIVVIGGTAGCSTPVSQFERRAQTAGLERIEVPTERFTHLIYRSRTVGSTTVPPDMLVVYLDGDGTPGSGGAEPSTDPTPREPLALSLLIRSSHPAIYLTRPCYNGTQNQAACSNRLWTSARYSPTVVNSMAAALGRYAHGLGNPPLVLVGYSGGGTLAMLMAAQTPKLKGVITIAANLDTDAWTAAHGYLPLEGSLNPARLDDLAVPTVHLIGENDVNVAPAMLTDYFSNHPRAQVWRYGSFDHRCCWVEKWPALLEQALRYVDTAESIPPSKSP
jgi:hypothetical protein